MKVRTILSVLLVVLLMAAFVPQVSRADDIVYIKDDLTALQTTMVKRARQLMEIPWVCRKTTIALLENPLDLSSEDNIKFSVNTRYHGIPKIWTIGYSGHKYVGYSTGASLTEFLTASQNTNGSFYQNFSGGYYRVTYGEDSSSFISYAWGLKTRATSNVLRNYEVQNSSFDSESDLNNLLVGDAFVGSDGATFFVASIERDADGNVTRVITWECSKTTASRAKNIIVFDKANTSTSDFETQNRPYLTSVSHITMSLEALRNRASRMTHIRNTAAASELDPYTHSCAVPLDGEFCENCTPPLASPVVTASCTQQAGSVILSWNPIINPFAGDPVAIGYEILAPNSTTPIYTTNTSYAISCSSHSEGGVYKVRAVRKVSGELPYGSGTGNLYMDYSDYSRYTEIYIAPYPVMQQPVAASGQTNAALISWKAVAPESAGLQYRLY